MEQDMTWEMAQRIKWIIKHRKMTQREAAQRSGFTEQQFCDMMHGRKLILAEHLLKIANALEVTPNDLFGISPGILT